MVNHATLTAAMIDSREFINARRRADAQVLLPKGTRIAFAGGVDCNDHHRIWAVLDKVHAKHPDMVLLHGGTPRGAEKIAACWADARKVPQVVFKPDWTRHQKAAPFKRNDQLLEALPIGVVVFPGSGVTDNLADKATATRHPAVRLPQARRRVSAAHSHPLVSHWSASSHLSGLTVSPRFSLSHFVSERKIHTQQMSRRQSEYSTHQNPSPT